MSYGSYNPAHCISSAGSYSVSSPLEQIAGIAVFYHAQQQDMGHQESYRPMMPNTREQQTYAGAGMAQDVQRYTAKSSYAGEQLHIHFTPEYSFVSDAFLKPSRAPQPFVGDAADIEKDVKDAFFATLGTEFPSDIRVAVLHATEFDKQIADTSVVGFSLNRTELGLISVFVNTCPISWPTVSST
jgi:hypothetical protein